MIDTIKIITHSDKRPLPEYDLPQPPFLDPNSEHCLIFPLFIGDDDEVVSDYHTYLVNSAFWAAHSWRVNSDCIEQGWNIYFFVERRLYEQPAIWQQFRKANMTDDVILFDAIPGEARHFKYGLKLYATLHPAFDKYKRAYLLDADMFLASKNVDIPFNVKHMLDIGKDESLLNLLSAIRKSRFRYMRHNYDLPGEAGKAKMKKHLTAYLGREITHGFACLGGIIAWNPTQLRQDFKEMVRTLTPDVSNDETQYAIYRVKQRYQRYNKELSALWHNLHLIGFLEQYLSNNLTHFLDHTVLCYSEKDDPGYDGEPFATAWRQWTGIYRR